MKKGNWKIHMGFATGSPQGRNSGWFTITENHKNCTLVNALDETMSTGFLMNDDISASWLFWCEDGNGKLVPQMEQAKAEFELTKKFIKEFGE